MTACLAALSHEQYEAHCEIIVVAGGSDGTLDEARTYSQFDSRIRVLAQRPGGGKNGAMNDAARIATGQVLVFLDADTLVTPGWLRALVAALGGDFAASTGKFLSLHRTLISRVGEMSQLLENEARRQGAAARQRRYGRAPDCFRCARVEYRRARMLTIGIYLAVCSRPAIESRMRPLPFVGASAHQP